MTEPTPSDIKSEPSEPELSIRRMSGFVTSFNQISHDIVARANLRGNVYVPSPSHEGPEVHHGDHIVFIDKRAGDGFTKRDAEITPARVFGLIERNRPPVVYVFVGMHASRSVPQAQRERAALKQRNKFGHS